VTSVTKLYVGAVIAAGVLLFAGAAPREYPPLPLTMTFLAAMMVVSIFKLRLPLGRGQSTMSMAYVIDFAVIVTLGAGLAMVIAAAGVLVQCLVRVRRTQPWFRTAFSVAAVAMAVQAAGWTWSVLGGTIAEPGMLTTIVPLAAAAVVCFAVNTGLVAIAIALSHNLEPGASWLEHFVRTAPAYVLTAGALATIQVLLQTSDAHVVLPAVAVPMLLCHMAYAFWFRQIAERQAVQQPVLA
jgi:hypothetical protein